MHAGMVKQSIWEARNGSCQAGLDNRIGSVTKAHKGAMD